MLRRNRGTGTRAARATAAGAVSLLVACSGGGETSGPPQSVPDALPGTPPEVVAALLTAEELGSQWVDLGAAPMEQRGFDSCPQSRVVTAGDEPDRVGEAQSAYSEGDPPAPFLEVSVSLWRSPDAARSALAEFASGASACRSFEDTLLDGRRVTVTVEQRPAPPLGDESVALLVRGEPDEGPAASSDVVVVRLGDALVLTATQRVEGEPTPTLTPDRFEELTRRAVDEAARELS